MKLRPKTRTTCRGWRSLAYGVLGIYYCLSCEEFKNWFMPLFCGLYFLSRKRVLLLALSHMLDHSLVYFQRFEVSLFFGSCTKTRIPPSFDCIKFSYFGGAAMCLSIRANLPHKRRDTSAPYHLWWAIFTPTLTLPHCLHPDRYLRPQFVYDYNFTWKGLAQNMQQ